MATPTAPDRCTRAAILPTAPNTGDVGGKRLRNAGVPISQSPATAVRGFLRRHCAERVLRVGESPEETRRFEGPPVDELGQELMGAADRSGDELREKGRKEREIGKRSLGCCASVDVDDVAENLKRVEGDGQWKEDVDWFMGCRAEQRHGLKDEVRVLVVS